MHVIAEARARGFELEERVVGDGWVWGWRRDDDERWPCFHERRQAVSWMRDRLGRTAVFEEKMASSERDDPRLVIAAMVGAVVAVAVWGARRIWGEVRKRRQ